MAVTSMAFSTIKLNNNNYQLWKHQLKILLKAKKVWYVIESEKPKIEENTQEAEQRKIKDEIEKYEEKSAVAASIILSTLESSQAQQVINLDEAKDIWFKLKEIHEGKVSSRRIELRLQLSAIKKVE
ncbi:hypothetical protein QE152_g4970 [Popillia japonica]|uniref:DUF4219 domain-containing protein n=1 Tax=Popillia japonica TaxID=7064 RepID=A0AAW1MYR1_POPJA